MKLNKILPGIGKDVFKKSPLNDIEPGVIDFLTALSPVNIDGNFIDVDSKFKPYIFIHPYAAKYGNSFPQSEKYFLQDHIISGRKVTYNPELFQETANFIKFEIAPLVGGTEQLQNIYIPDAYLKEYVTEEEQAQVKNKKLYLLLFAIPLLLVFSYFLFKKSKT